jgi:selenocysteine-specific elongation factor
VRELAAALERAAAGTASRAAGATSRAAGATSAAAGATSAAADPGPAVLHVDRVFTIRGAGTVVTGTLWSGVIRRGERLSLLPGQRTARVRGVQVHDRAVEEAAAGQRVAVNFTGLERRAVTRGDVLVGAGAPVSLTHRLEARLTLHERLSDRERVQVHHGTRATPARAVRIDGDVWQLRCERPLVAADGDRIVLRRIAPPDTLGGGVIVRAAAGGRSRAEDEVGPAAAKATSPPPAAAPPPLDAAALALEERLRAAGHEPPSEAELGDEAANLRALHAAGRAVRIGRSMHAHPDAIADVRAVVERIARSEGQITLARLRDELATSRKYAQALLEHLDAARVTRRRPDDTRVLRSAAR